MGFFSHAEAEQTAEELQDEIQKVQGVLKPREGGAGPWGQGSGPGVVLLA